jgi:hypothetical protein
MKSFFAELKRRNVYKVAVAYAVFAWLLVQIATQIFPFFEIPKCLEVGLTVRSFERPAPLQRIPPVPIDPSLRSLSPSKPALQSRT